MRSVTPLLLAVLLWSLCLWRAVQVFSPQSASHGSPYNSDTAIPVLMANDDRPLSIFDLYYYGADRWGSWLFLGAKYLHQVAAIHWSPERLTGLQVVWVFLGAWVMAALARRDRYVVLLAYLLTLCLHRQSRYLLLDLSQVYAWIFVPILLSWHALRRVLELDDGMASGWRWPCLLWRSSRYVLALSLALCSSIASLPYVGVVFALEVMRWRLRRERGAWRGWLVPLWALVLTGCGLSLEVAMKRVYHEYAIAHFGADFHWEARLDGGHLLENLAQHLAYVGGLHWRALYLAPLAVILVLAFRALARRRPQCPAPRVALRGLARDETALLAVGLFGMAVLNLLLVVLLEHVRLNLYIPRYLTLMNFCAPLSGMLALYLLVDRGTGLMTSHGAVRSTVLLGGVVLLAWRMPPNRSSPDFACLRDVARALEARAPGAVLLGGYWQTYVFSSLQAGDRALTPLPFAGQEGRTPWNRDALPLADLVVVEYACSNLGTAGELPLRLSQHGCELELVKSRWLVRAPYAFALYRNIPRGMPSAGP
ncbi:MAG: hypothetical protein K8T26_19065 [Lentisphaerae bacterium]|nr:hypothetical protein [Lentisphaerota bacterium]